MPDQIEELLSRGVEEVIDKSHLERALKSKKKLRVKLGIDPNRPDLHIGHAVPLLKLKEFQSLGHTAVLIIGDWTAMIGDPSGKDETRPALSRKDVDANSKQFVKQANLILDPKRTEIHFQSEWFKKMGLADIMKLASLVSMGELLSHETFRKRIKEQLPFALHEALYPLLQGYDSVAVKSDLELGDPAQKFNVLMGRHLQRQFGQEPQDIMLVPILIGLDGKEKMSKSLGNYIALRDEANDMFGKVMSVNDELIKKYFVLATRVPLEEVDEIISSHNNPRDQKLILAEKITELYHSAKKAAAAKQAFVSQFSKGELPADIGIFAAASAKVSDLLTLSGLAASKSEARRLIEQGGVKINSQAIADDELVELSEEPKLFQVGKRKFLKIKQK